MQRFSVPLLLLGLAPAQSGSPVSSIAQPGPRGSDIAHQPLGQRWDRVLHDDPGTGVLWSTGIDWKASFGRDGFAFVPFLGAAAPRSFPLRFRVQRVLVGGRELTFAESVAPVRTGDRIAFDRGALHEIYDLRLREVEQTFVIDTPLAGDVVVELAIAGELREDAARPGLQFTNELGGVGYGDAFVVHDGHQTPIATAWADGVLRLQVPAALRGNGPLRIDPILNTQSVTFHGLRPALYPDVAYDATNDVYLAVWQSVFSATDQDVHSEMFDGNGVPVPFSNDVFDSSTLDYTTPRLGNLNAHDRFLCAMERVDPSQWNGTMQIYGRVRDAGGARTIGAEVLLSDPTLPGNAEIPDVGGDPGTRAADNDQWLVVWSRPLAASVRIISCQFVMSDGTPLAGGEFFVNNEPNEELNGARVSRARREGGNSWLVVYDRVAPAGDYDVWATEVVRNGGFGPRRAIAETRADEWVPQVSSPIAGGRYLVEYLQSNPDHSIGALYNVGNGAVEARVDLTQSFGIGPTRVRVDSDGLRFALAWDFGGNNIAAATLAPAGNTLALHEGAQLVQAPAEYPRIASTHSSGGPRNRYGIVSVDTSASPPITMLSIYAGRASGPTIVARPTACNGLQLSWTGEPLLGQSVQFDLANLASDLPGFLIGFPNPTALPTCSTCTLGVRLDAGLALLLGQRTTVLAVPPILGLVGTTLSVQGVSLGRSTCAGPISLSDTADLTIR